MDGELPSDQPGDWPSMTQVESYRARIRHELDSALADVDETEELVQLLNIAIEHRLMHAETLEYMFHQLPFESKTQPPSQIPPSARQTVPRMITITEGPVTLGLTRESSQFGWDNEREAVTVDVPAFSIDQYKVTNGQFVEFVKAGGYSQQQLWSPVDWEWRSAAGISHPVFWVPGSDGFRYRGMFEEIPLSASCSRLCQPGRGIRLCALAGESTPNRTRVAARGAGALYLPLRHARCGTRRLSVPLWARQALSAWKTSMARAWEWTSSPISALSWFQGGSCLSRLLSQLL